LIALGEADFVVSHRAEKRTHLSSTWRCLNRRPEAEFPEDAIAMLRLRRDGERADENKLGARGYHTILEKVLD